MTVRVNASTLAAGVSDAWTPAGTADVILQASSAGDLTSLVVQVETQLNAAAPWAAVIAWRPASEPLVQISHLPSVRVSWRGNAGTFNVWDAE